MGTARPSLSTYTLRDEGKSVEKGGSPRSLAFVLKVSPSYAGITRFRF
jgi:hypothetical protein